jgi:hypothetical protein
VVIDGQTFDLAREPVFLVTFEDNKTIVDQVAVDMEKRPDHPIEVENKLQAIGKTVPRMAAFLNASHGEK